LLPLNKLIRRFKETPNTPVSILYHISYQYAIIIEKSTEPFEKYQQFKVSSVWFISPGQKDKSGPVFMKETADDVPQSAIKIVPATGPLTGRTVILIPRKQSRVKQDRYKVQQAEVPARMVLPMPKVVFQVVPVLIPYRHPVDPPVGITTWFGCDYFFGVFLGGNRGGHFYKVPDRVHSFFGNK
jgi:hypothetical protein